MMRKQNSNPKDEHENYVLSINDKNSNEQH